MLAQAAWFSPTLFLSLPDPGDQQLREERGEARSRLTLGADAPEVSDLHEHPREHVGLAGPSPPGIEPQGFQQRLLKLVHFLRLLQVHAVWGDKHRGVREEEMGKTVTSGPALRPSRPQTLTMSPTQDISPVPIPSPPLARGFLW